MCIAAVSAHCQRDRSRRVSWLIGGGSLRYFHPFESRNSLNREPSVPSVALSQRSVAPVLSSRGQLSERQSGRAVLERRLTACVARWRWPDEFAGRRLEVAVRELCT